jgi:hypothetical protein
LRNQNLARPFAEQNASNTRPGESRHDDGIQRQGNEFFAVADGFDCASAAIGRGKKEWA